MEREQRMKEINIEEEAKVLNEKIRKMALASDLRNIDNEIIFAQMKLEEEKKIKLSQKYKYFIM